MTCSACRRASEEWLCSKCRLSLADAPDQVRGGVLVRSAFAHEGAARLLIHRLKYEAVAGIARRLGAALEPLLGSDASALVPIPRVPARRWRYGIDSGLELAAALSRRTGLPVVRALGPRTWVRRRAGSTARPRGVPTFRLRIPVPPGAVLIDDVVTTGTTVAAGAAASGSRSAITVTASRLPGGTHPDSTGSNGTPGRSAPTENREIP